MTVLVKNHKVGCGTGRGKEWGDGDDMNFDILSENSSTMDYHGKSPAFLQSVKNS